MLIQPLFSLLAGGATIVFACAACLGLLRRPKSAFFFILAAGATAFLFLINLPRTPLDVVQICALTAVANVAVHRGAA
jgi:hypothetical protein